VIPAREKLLSQASREPKSDDWDQRSQPQRLKSKILDLALKWPIVSSGDQSSTKRILANVLPLLTVALTRSQNMIEEFGLPDGNRISEIPNQTLARPLLPKLHELGQRFCIEFTGAEEMHVIRHDDITTDRPAMPLPRISPFFNQNCSRSR